MTTYEWLKSNLNHAMVVYVIGLSQRSLAGLNRSLGESITRVSATLKCFEVWGQSQNQCPRLDSVVNAMHIGSKPHTVSIHFVLAFAFLFSSSMQSFAQSEASSIPENSHTKSYGIGWECNRGFKSDGGKCSPITVPENARLSDRSYGKGWECHYGYKEDGGKSCNKTVVPEGGYLDAYGDGWRCLRGYRNTDESCEKIVVPVNAYLTDDVYGGGWSCERGYARKSDECLAIIIPKHAFLNSANYGQPWLCERGYFEVEGTCSPILIPANAYLDDTFYGIGWKCERGFAASDDACKAVIIPQNAHLDRSGNAWECNQSFQKTNGLCVLENQ